MPWRDDWLEAGSDSSLPALILASLVTSTVASSALMLLSSSRYLHYVLLAFLFGVDALIQQGGSILLLLEPASRAPSCRVFALFALLFLLLLVATLASLAALPSTSCSIYLHLILPPLFALSISLPFAFPEVAHVGFFTDRYTCGFINLSTAYATVILLLGFIFPFAVLLYFCCSKSLPFKSQPRQSDVYRSGRTIIYLVSLCSILLIPHIIQINITHFSTKLFKTKRDIAVIYTGVYDSFSIWLRYAFDFLTPLIMCCALVNIKDLRDNLRDICTGRSYFARYVRSAGGRRAKWKTPVLFASADGLRLLMGKDSYGADPPEPNESTDNSSMSKGESSTSTTTTDFSKPSRNPGNKKIVRFAHSVKEITWKDSDRWDIAEGSSRDRV